MSEQAGYAVYASSQPNVPVERIAPSVHRITKQRRAAPSMRARW
jgi:hypothetical protein